MAKRGGRVPRPAVGPLKALGGLASTTGGALETIVLTEDLGTEGSVIMEKPRILAEVRGLGGGYVEAEDLGGRGSGSWDSLDTAVTERDNWETATTEQDSFGRGGRTS